MHITRSWHTRGGPARLTGNEPVSMSVETVRECIRRLDRFGHVWASFLCVSCAVHLLSCRLVNPENPSAFEVMDPCCGAGVYLALFSANGYGLTVVLLMRRCLCQCCAGSTKIRIGFVSGVQITRFDLGGAAPLGLNLGGAAPPGPNHRRWLLSWLK